MKSYLMAGLLNVRRHLILIPYTCRLSAVHRRLLNSVSVEQTVTIIRH